MRRRFRCARRTRVLQLSDGQAERATLLSLEEVSLDGQAFVGIAPPDEIIDSLVALDADGDVLERYDLGR